MTSSELNKPFPVDSLAWLLKATIDTTVTATPVVRLTSHVKPITWQSKTYEPCQFEVGSLAVDTQGRRDTLEITLDNRSLEVGRWIAHGRGCRDQPFELYLVDRATLGPDPIVQLKGFIDEPIVTDKAVTLTIRQSKASSRKWPWMRFVPGCHATYKDPGTCGYDGSLVACAKTLTACHEHGDDEAANGRAVIHPQRFHGFPGIPRASR